MCARDSCGTHQGLRSASRTATARRPDPREARGWQHLPGPTSCAVTLARRLFSGPQFPQVADVDPEWITRNNVETHSAPSGSSAGTQNGSHCMSASVMTSVKVCDDPPGGSARRLWCCCSRGGYCGSRERRSRAGGCEPGDVGRGVCHTGGRVCQTGNLRQLLGPL